MLGLELPEGMEYTDLGYQPAPASNERALRDDLRRWRSVALRRLKSGDSPAYEFQSDYIPPGQAAEILDALRAAKTVEEVKAAFAAGFRDQRKGGRYYP